MTRGCAVAIEINKFGNPERLAVVVRAMEGNTSQYPVLTPAA